jgi:hypothetical protein
MSRRVMSYLTVWQLAGAPPLSCPALHAFITILHHSSMASADGIMRPLRANFIHF